MSSFIDVEEWISFDNTKKIQYVLLFFIFLLALSYNVFDRLFGDSLKEITKNIYVRHSIGLLFLYLLVDLNLDKIESSMNPIASFFVSIFIYFLVFILLHSHYLFIVFIVALVLFLIVLDKYKKYLQQSVQDQEIMQEHLDLIYKTNNVFVILMILTIIIGSISSFDSKSIKNI
jgi:hypothetical protein